MKVTTRFIAGSLIMIPPEIKNPAQGLAVLMIGAIVPTVIAVMRPLTDRRNETTW
jgi:hypothetical protein